LGDHHSRATYFGVAYERIDRTQVFERDDWTCGICSLAVDPAARFPDAGSATLDHVVPMSRGGGHVWANVQLAHFYCNSIKGARDLEVLAC
jgi:5-methylcytosine-specific restriction endonuclease McrA